MDMMKVVCVLCVGLSALCAGLGILCTGELLVLTNKKEMLLLPVQEDIMMLQHSLSALAASAEQYRKESQDFAMTCGLRAVATVAPDAKLSIEGRPIPPFPIAWKQEPAGGRSKESSYGGYEQQKTIKDLPAAKDGESKKGDSIEDD